MRGGQFLHNRIMVGQLAAAFQRIGADVRCEHPVRLGRHPRFVDILAVIGALRIVCEAERNARRARNDVSKALALRASLLLIVVPNASVAASAKRQLAAEHDAGPAGLTILVLTLGAALQLLTDKCHLMSALNVAETFVLHPPGAPSPIRRSEEREERNE